LPTPPLWLATAKTRRGGCLRLHSYAMHGIAWHSNAWQCKGDVAVPFWGGERGLAGAHAVSRGSWAGGLCETVEQGAPAASRAFRKHNCASGAAFGKHSCAGEKSSWFTGFSRVDGSEAHCFSVTGLGEAEAAVLGRGRPERPYREFPGKGRLWETPLAAEQSLGGRSTSHGSKKTRPTQVTYRVPTWAAGAIRQVTRRGPDRGRLIAHLAVAAGEALERPRMLFAEFESLYGRHTRGERRTRWSRTRPSGVEALC